METQQEWPSIELMGSTAILCGTLLWAVGYRAIYRAILEQRTANPPALSMAALGGAVGAICSLVLSSPLFASSFAWRSSESFAVGVLAGTVICVYFTPLGLFAGSLGGAVGNAILGATVGVLSFLLPFALWCVLFELLNLSSYPIVWIIAALVIAGLSGAAGGWASAMRYPSHSRRTSDLFQFKLRALLAFVVLVSLLFGWVAIGFRRVGTDSGIRIPHVGPSMEEPARF